MAPLMVGAFYNPHLGAELVRADGLDQPLVMENIPGFFDVKASQLPEPVWLRRFFDATGAGFLLDLPHVWLEAHYRNMKPAAWLAEFPLEQVVELHVAGVEQDADLQ